MKWILGVAAASVLVTGCSDGDGSADRELGPASNGATLNNSSWPQVADGDGVLEMQMLISGTVRVDANGCVYLEGKRPDVVTNILWPAGYTASRQPDGTVTISNADGVVVAATGHRLIASGGGLPPNPDPAIEWACTAEGANQAILMITDWLPR